MNLRKIICRLRKHHRVNRHTCMCVTCGTQTYLREKEEYPTLSEYLGTAAKLFDEEKGGKKHA